MSIIRYIILLLVVVLFSSCNAIAENMTWTGLLVLSVILVLLFGTMFYLLLKRKRQADKSLVQFTISVQAMLSKLDTTDKKIKSLEVLIKRINEDEKYKKDTTWRDKVLAKTYLFLATQYFDKGNVDKMLEICTKILELTPDDGMTLYNRGSIYSNMREYEKALVDFNKSIEFLDEYANLYNNRGMVLHRLGRYEEALADFDKAIELEDTAISYLNRGLTQTELNNITQAEDDYDKALELCKNDEELKAEILAAKEKLSSK